MARRTSTTAGSRPRKRRAKVPEYVVAYVWARAAGRCEFCNVPVWMDVLTTKEANVGKLAHIVGASSDGPRGDPVESPRLAKDPSNIMLLCGTHHDLVDSKQHVATYPKELLRQYKAIHDDRVERLTAITANKKSVPVLVEIPVGSYVLNTPPAELSAAIAAEGWYPDATRKVHVDLNGMTARDHDEAFWKEARTRLTDRLAQQLTGAEHDGPLQHLSIFGFGPMPLLVLLGHLLDDKVPANVFNRIRVPKGWTWPRDSRRITGFDVTAPNSVEPGAEVALILSVTSQVQVDDVRRCIPSDLPIFCCGWSNPALDCLRAPEELEEFVEAARNVMERIHRVRASRVHLFPAVPVAAAVEFGRSLQKKLHAPLALYDFHQASGGWRFAFELTARATT